jgi:glycosyltransferase involved in cell wall biosynthesis
MKIVLINTSDSAGGASIACRRLGFSLRQLGHEVTFLVKEKQTQEDWIVQVEDGLWKGESTHYAEKLFFLPYEASKKIRFQFSTASFGINIAAHPAVRNADILHFHWINKGFISFKGMRQLAALGKPIIWTCHDMWPFTGGCHYAGECTRYENNCGSCPFIKGDSEMDLSRQIWQKKKTLYSKINLHAVTCSQWLGNTAKSSGLFSNKPVTTIPNPINTLLYAPGYDPKPDSGTNFTVLFQAMNIDDERKGFVYLLGALQLVKEKYPDIAARIRILLFGKCNPETLAQIPFPVDYIGMLKNETDIIEAYRQADIFVIPSLEENLPNTIMESLACGVPVVAFASGGIPEMVQHLHNGYLSPVRDTSSLADGIFTLLKDQEQLRALSQNARLWAIDHYSEQVVAKKYVEVYQESLSLQP